jgi:ribonuclease P protein component
VSKKVNKSAVVRNRIRRRIYEVIRANEVGIKKPYDIVVTVFDDRVAEMPAQELNQTLIDLLQQGNMLSL